MPYLENLIPSTAIIDIAFDKPISCGIGTMVVEGGTVGDQCKDEDRIPINRVSRIRNQPNVS